MRQKLVPRGLSAKAVTALKKHSPTILTCIGAAGVLGTAVLAVKATPRAILLIEEEKAAKNAGNGQKLTRMETIAVCWRCYLPAVATGAATIGCIFGANILNKRQQASLMSAYAFLNRSFKEYQNAVKEVFGEEGHQRVIDRLMVEKPEVPSIYGAVWGETFDFGETDEPKHLFYDAFSQRYFEAKISDVLLAELHTNRNFAIRGEISIQEFYAFLGLDTPEDLKDLYWYVCDYYYFIDFAHTKHYIDDGLEREPVECWSIEMPYPPTLEPLEL